MHESIIYKDECYNIQGAVFEVYKELGSGFLESVYQECLAKEFSNSNIPFEQECKINLNYKGGPLNQYFKADFVCYDKIILEIKSCKNIAPEHKAQTLNYLKATNNKLALLINFGSYPKVEIIRLAL